MSSERRRNALSLDSGACNLFTFNYESLSGYVRELRAIIPDQTLLVFDEVHRVKAIKQPRESRARGCRWAKFVIALTGTPIPNTYQDIYNLLHILYPEDYDTFFGFEPGELRAPDVNLQTSLNDSLAPSVERTRISRWCRTRNPTRSWRLRQRLTKTRCYASYIHHVPTLLRESYAPCNSRMNPEMLCSAVDPDDLERVLDQVGDDYSDIDYVDFSQTFYEAIE